MWGKGLQASAFGIHPTWAARWWPLGVEAPLVLCELVINPRFHLSDKQRLWAAATLKRSWTAQQLSNTGHIQRSLKWRHQWLLDTCGLSLASTAPGPTWLETEIVTSSALSTLSPLMFALSWGTWTQAVWILDQAMWVASWEISSSTWVGVNSTALPPQTAPRGLFWWLPGESASHLLSLKSLF